MEAIQGYSQHRQRLSNVCSSYYNPDEASKTRQRSCRANRESFGAEQRLGTRRLLESKSTAFELAA